MSPFQRNLFLTCLFFMPSVAFAMEGGEDQKRSVVAAKSSQEPKPVVFWSVHYTPDEASSKTLNRVFWGSEDEPYGKVFTPITNCLMVQVKEDRKNALPFDYVKKNCGVFFSELQNKLESKLRDKITVTPQKVISLEELLREEGKRGEHEFPYIQVDFKKDKLLKDSNNEAEQSFNSKKGEELYKAVEKDLDIKYMTRPANYSSRMTLCRAYKESDKLSKEARKAAREACAKALQKRLSQAGEISLTLKLDFKLVDYVPDVHCPVYFSDLKEPVVPAQEQQQGEEPGRPPMTPGGHS